MREVLKMEIEKCDSIKIDREFLRRKYESSMKLYFRRSKEKICDNILNGHSIMESCNRKSLNFDF